MAKPLISIQRRDAIVDDLISQHPKGPNGTLTKNDYYRTQRYSQSRRMYLKTTIPTSEGASDSFFGYDLDTLQRVWWECNRGDLSSYVCERWEDKGQKARKRRFNRLFDRLTPGHDAFRKQAARGIWEVRLSYRVKLYVMAGSSNTAKLLTRTMLAGCGMKFETHQLRANLINVDEPDLLAHYTNKNMKTVSDTIARSLREIKTLKETVEQHTHLLSALEDFGEVQPSMLGEATG